MQLNKIKRTDIINKILDMINDEVELDDETQQLLIDLSYSVEE
jgi:hypothetical protein